MSTTLQTAIGQTVWHECLSTDVDKAKDFYTKLLGWELETWKPGEFDYAMIKANGQTHGGFNEAQGGAPSHWLTHVVVDDVDAAASKATRAGGKILAGPMDMPEIGRFALIQDPQGAVISAYAPAGGDEPVAEGTFVWDELLTEDVEAAKRFYSDIFGWTTTEMQGGMGTYTIFHAGDRMVAGCMTLPPPAKAMGAPPHWLTYLGTNDVDKTAAKAKELGAKLYMEPFDVPEVGRIAVLADPTGAPFGLFKPSES